MINVVAQAIDQYYIKKDYATFIKRCNTLLPLCKDLKTYIKAKEFTLRGGDERGLASQCWRVEFNDYKHGELEISYATEFQISKVAPLFYIQHEFSVDHKNKNRVDPSLDGFNDSAYTKEQFELDDTIRTILIKEGYHVLNYFDMKEAVEGFTMPEGVTIFGHNVTVELLLFVDVLNICPDDSQKIFLDMIKKHAS